MLLAMLLSVDVELATVDELLDVVVVVVEDEIEVLELLDVVLVDVELEELELELELLEFELPPRFRPVPSVDPST